VCPRNVGLSPIYIAYSPEDSSRCSHRRENTKSDKILKRYLIKHLAVTVELYAFLPSAIDEVRALAPLHIG
jgi:hypothetical protein